MVVEREPLSASSRERLCVWGALGRVRGLLDVLDEAQAGQSVCIGLSGNTPVT